MARQIPSLIMGTCAALTLGACQTTADTVPVEAQLTKSSPATTAILTQAVSKALGGRNITLAPNILTDSSKLIMDPKFVDDRSMERPDHFTLMKEGKTCYLVHEETSAKIPLAQVNCQAL